ncbi:MAG: GatB/YqeY domain-containing protein [Anaerolineae bacterium]|nr:GatB/YqeY domain-containing protein [Anaerolineae bacterium]MCB0179824.1 GatB/YqeY domain-containing protein [Anaerolineae bacterium]MCB9102935.1 GatB/YqeY domain-containing protein [Anaerolineales bacterium]
MSVIDQINSDLKTAMKSGQKELVATLRSLKSAIKYAEIEAGGELNDEATIGVLSKQAKQRRDSIAEFEKAGRSDLVAQETAELQIIETYLPAQLSEEEIRAKVQAVITALNVTDTKGMGQVMKQVMADLKGQADGKTVNQIVRQLLSG